MLRFRPTVQIANEAPASFRSTIVADGDPQEIVDIHMQHAADRETERLDRIARMAGGEIPLTSTRFGRR